MPSIYIVLHNIRSAYNVGSILRTADAAGVTGVYLTGCTPSPIDRFGRKRPDIAKVALGAEETVHWEYTEDINDAIRLCTEQNIRIVGVEQSPESLPYTAPYPNTPTAFILGEETQGITEDILKQCDTIVEIPMAGKKESLNVSVAAGIVLFRFVEQFS